MEYQHSEGVSDLDTAGTKFDDTLARIKEEWRLGAILILKKKGK